MMVMFDDRRAAHLRRLLLVLLLAVGGCAREPQVAATIEARRSMRPEASRLLREAHEAFGRGDWQSALRQIDAAAVQAPQLADLPYLRGRVLLELNRYDEAEEAFRRVLELDPLYAGASFQLGHLATQRAHYHEALEYYRKEAALLEAAAEGAYVLPTRDPRALAAVRLQMGRTLEALDDVEAARAMIESAIAADTTFAQAYSDLSKLYQEDGALDEAREYARRAYRLASDDPEYRYVYGMLLLRTDSADEALPHLEAVVQARPWHHGALYNLGRALTELGRAGEAQEYLARADRMQQLENLIAQAQVSVQQSPDDARRWAEYAELLARSGRTAEARRAFGVAQSIAGQEAE